MSDSPDTGVDKIVGHKTFDDGNGGFYHEPLYAAEAEALLRAAKEQELRRIASMPDESTAIHALFEAWTRLKELGWNDSTYCPKDGSTFDAIEAGSTGIHRCHYSGKWPTGTWWVEASGDLWPSRPILYRTPRVALKDVSTE
jgi:hypothetical protein